MKSVLAFCCGMVWLGAGLSGPVHAARQSPRSSIDVAKLGPQVGERVPDFRLVDQAGAIRTLRSIIGPAGAMLVFYRSADW